MKVWIGSTGSYFQSFVTVSPTQLRASHWASAESGYVNQRSASLCRRSMEMLCGCELPRGTDRTVVEIDLIARRPRRPRPVKKGT